MIEILPGTFGAIFKARLCLNWMKLSNVMVLTLRGIHGLTFNTYVHSAKYSDARESLIWVEFASQRNDERQIEIRVRFLLSFPLEVIAEDG